MNEPRALDLLSASLSTDLEKIRTHIIIGDYRLEFGQGLVFSRYSRSYFDGGNCETNRESVTGNSFFEESLYLRGILVKFQKKRVSALVCSSLRTLDATIDDTGHVVTIIQDGYHYPGEKRDNLKEYTNVARLSLTRFYGFGIGVSGTISRYTPSLARKNGEKYIYYPEGSTFGYISFDGDYRRGPLKIFFEHVERSHDGHASAGGFHFVNNGVQSYIHIRNYSDDYWAYHSGSFSSFGNISNEQGLYTGVEAELPRSSRLAFSMDLARTLSRTYSKTMPVSRRRLSFMFHTRIHGDLLGTMNARSVHESGDSGSRWNCRLMLEEKQRKTRKIGWRTLTAWSSSDDGGGMYAEIGLFSEGRGFTIDFSSGYFDIPSYKSRFFRYEHDVPGRGMTRAVWGQGGIVSVVIRWKVLSARYSYSDSNSFERLRECIIQSDLLF
jgi:hypothetical protein